MEDIYSQLENGLNLIHALEQSTGERVGKYNKRAMLPVHKIDNWSVVLAFLGKKGVDVRAFTPQGEFLWICWSVRCSGTDMIPFALM